MLEALQAMSSVILDPFLLLLIFATTIIGVIIGVLPGIGATTGAALLLPFTLTMTPVHAITVLATIYVSATFAGSITAILINTPGTSAAAATTFDGFPLAQRGEAGRALGVAVVSSTVGGIFSVIVLCIAAPMLARVAYHFRPPEYFALTLFGLSMLASISSGGAIKNLIGGVFGVWVATIGAEPTTGIERFMFGNYDLYEGLSFVPVFIGLFAMSELLVQSKKANQIASAITMKAVKLPTIEDYKKIWKTIVRSCGIGTFIGILPAEGATVASMIGYAEARRWSKNKEEFGKGSIEGIAGAESANNAATGGAMVPTMVLGIPGSGTTAIILVGLSVWIIPENELYCFLCSSWLSEADKSEAFRISLSISHDCSILNFSKFFEEFLQTVFSEALIFWETFDVDIVEGPLVGSRLLGLVLKYSKVSCLSITLR